MNNTNICRLVLGIRGGWVKLEEIVPNATFNATVRVISGGDERKVKPKKKKSKSLRVCEFQVADDTCILPFTLFNKEINLLKNEVGNVVAINNGWAKKYLGNIQLSLGFSGSWEVIDDPTFPSIKEIEKTREIRNNKKITTPLAPSGPILVNEIITEEPFSTIVRVFFAHRAKTYKKASVKTFMVGDETGIIPFTTFNEDRFLFKELMGQVILLENCWPRLYNGMMEISKGIKGTWKLLPSKEKDFITKEDLLDQYQKTQLDLCDTLEMGQVYYSEIVGSYYHPKGYSVSKKRTKTRLDLVPEPTNPYDSNAVAVYYQGSKVGYIPRKQNRGLFKTLTKGGIPIECTLGVYIPQRARYTFPRKSKNPLITISTIVDDVEWRPMILYPEDLVMV